ncbi:MAG: TadE/TadG family type IV pilus assembly protein [Actinomycetota bacterium]
MAGRERGAAAVELVLFLPLLVFLVAAGVFVAHLVLQWGDLTDVSRAGARYATRASLDPERPGVYRFRPTGAEVASYIEGMAAEQGLDVTSVSVSPDPSTAFPDTPVTVIVTARVDPGPLGRVANALFASFSDAACGEDFCLTQSATMREE